MVAGRPFVQNHLRLLRLLRVLGLPLIGLASVAADVATVLGQSGITVSCSKCHADAAFLSRHGPRADALYVTDTLLQDGAHATLRCLDCHPELGDGYPHSPSDPAPCRQCHVPEGTEWEASIHAVEEAAGDAATCLSCHGSPHATYGSDDRRSPTHALNVATTCGQCHSDPRIIGTYFTGPEDAQARSAVGDYHQTVHGSAMSAAGLIISATCNDCHESHRVLPAKASFSSVNRQHIAGTCGACHVGVLEIYESGSAHGSAFQTGLRTPEGLNAPACVDCHSAHQIVRTDEMEWFLGTSVKCGACHADLWETYLDTYHGQVTNLGFGLTAKCSDCHTPHNMRPASDPASSVHPANLVATCSRCHAQVTASYVKYYAHGDPRDRKRFPVLFWPWLFMTTLLVSVWSFFGVHSLLWLNGIRLERRKRGRQSDPRSSTP